MTGSEEKLGVRMLSPPNQKPTLTLRLIRTFVRLSLGVVVLIALQLCVALMNERSLIRRIESLGGIAEQSYIGPEVCPEALRSWLPFLRRITSITMNGTDKTEIESNDFHLRDLRGLPFLSELCMVESNLCDEDLRELAGMKSLQHLYLGENNITDEGCKSLATLTDLRTLYLQGHQEITDDGIRELLRLRKLNELNIAETSITNNSADAFARFSDLMRLNLCHTSFSKEGLATLEKESKIETVYLSGTTYHRRH